MRWCRNKAFPRDFTSVVACGPLTYPSLWSPPQHSLIVNKPQRGPTLSKERGVHSAEKTSLSAEAVQRRSCQRAFTLSHCVKTRELASQPARGKLPPSSHRKRLSQKTVSFYYHLPLWNSFSTFSTRPLQEPPEGEL